MEALQVIIDEVSEDLYEKTSDGRSGITGTTYGNEGDDTLELIIHICRKFNHFANYIGSNPHGKATVHPVQIQNEYDLQFYFGAILSIHTEDFLLEEKTPSLGGKSSSIDFILKRHKIGIELKIDLPKDELIEQINDDITKYKHHPDVNNGTLVFFVYDSNKKIKQPVALENDYELNHGSIKVKVVVTQ